MTANMLTSSWIVLTVMKHERLFGNATFAKFLCANSVGSLSITVRNFQAPACLGLEPVAQAAAPATRQGTRNQEATPFYIYIF